MKPQHDDFLNRAIDHLEAIVSEWLKLPDHRIEVAWVCLLIFFALWVYKMYHFDHRS